MLAKDTLVEHLKGILDLKKRIATTVTGGAVSVTYPRRYRKLHRELFFIEAIPHSGG
jgi:hypothetical protein